MRLLLKQTPDHGDHQASGLCIFDVAVWLISLALLAGMHIGVAQQCTDCCGFGLLQPLCGQNPLVTLKSLLGILL